jgi:predicted nuclease of predicted toxin-antitoxin system
VKLLLDHNISHQLVTRLANVFPESTQTRLLNFGQTNDPQLWLFAKKKGYVFVSKDSDVAELAILRGGPPKVVWLRMGNCRTAADESALRRNVDAILKLESDPDEVVLEIWE